MNNTELVKIKELLLSPDLETISLGFVLLRSDFEELYFYIRDKFPNPKVFDALIYKLLRCQFTNNDFRNLFINTSIIYYIDNYLNNPFI